MTVIYSFNIVVIVAIFIGLGTLGSLETDLMPSKTTSESVSTASGVYQYAHGPCQSIFIPPPSPIVQSKGRNNSRTLPLLM